MLDQTVPFESIQSPSSIDHKGSELTVMKNKGGSGIVSGAGQATMQQQAGSIFSFNSPYVLRVTTDAEGYNYDNNFDKSSTGSFDFSRASAHRTVVGPLLKPAPSKWDDAEKWLSAASDQLPGSVKVRSKSKSGPLQAHVVANQADVMLSKKVLLSNLSGGGHQSGTQNGTATQTSKVMNVVTDHCACDPSSSSSSSSSPSSGKTSGERGDRLSVQPGHKNYLGGRTKKVDGSAAKYITSEGSEVRGGGPRAHSACKLTGTPVPSAEAVDLYPLHDLYGHDHSDAKEGSMSPDATDDKFLKPTLRTAKPISESPTVLNPMDTSTAVTSSPGGTNTQGAVSTRDMGTEMTPIASVEPSRTATPMQATSPNLGSPINSRPPSPDRVIVPSSTPNASPATSKVLSGKELQAKTRQEILALGTQLGKANITAWATKDEEEVDAAKVPKAGVELEEVRKNLLASRAAAWEEAEQAKYTARYKREEVKIQAWENREKAKAEAEMRRMEVKVERMWSLANEKLMNKLAAAHQRAEDLRAASEARRSERIAKITSQAEHIRGTGKMPSTFFVRLCKQ
ncbi:unnamed protein product [Sphagnum jensenii]|uniref:Remorin C-terminal domain-containing protein n=1 Tax=Sphagnum jensenii TaxID=128206 RepID=A0ABP1BGL1_9BRYO